ncbi:hypothetical protein ABZV58_24155 [Nocardia sp. NPDC004654]|uniref:hypothetical protein n=1 Tax=Nocardia sp. NPDC004654 TaxID=3154776 RepID=UPI0033B01348
MVRSGDRMHAYLIDQVNMMLRRPQMYGGEPALWTTFDHLFFLEDEDRGRADLWESWRERNAFTPTGPKGALQRHLPGNDLAHALASMYAEAARNRGWLRLDRILTADEYVEIREAIASFTGQDRSYSDVIDTFGEPSVLFGSSNRLYGKTLAYATADAADPMVVCHLWNGVDEGAEQHWPRKYPEPLLLAIRYGTGSFPATFSFTPKGRRLRPQSG